MKLLINGAQGKDKPGVMIPIPQYPLYSATLAEFDLAQVDFEYGNPLCIFGDSVNLSGCDLAFVGGVLSERG